MKFQSKQEFEIYALMYVAALDMKTSKEELKMMNSKGSEELIQHVAEIFEQDNDAQRVDAIVQAAAEFIKTEEQKTEFFNDLKKMAAADSIAHIEAASLSILERMIIL
jgi:hypothetical protein